MADKTHIEWTDATWNVITGCSVISPGCTNCYAMKLAGTRLKNHPTRAGLTIDSKAGPVWNGEVRFNESMLLDPLRWRRPRNIFVCAHGDLFHEAVPDEWIDRVFTVMALAPQHTFQVLTKRPERMREYIVKNPGFNIRTSMQSIKRQAVIDMTWPLPNVLLGVSVEDQPRADERRDHLGTLAWHGWRTFVSYEPALGPVDWTGWDFLKWMISGGESQPGARPSHPDWHRAARDFCAANSIPYLFKQWGDWLPFGQSGFYAWDAANRSSQAQAKQWRGFARLVTKSGSVSVDWKVGPLLTAASIGGERRLCVKIGKSRAGRLLDGVEHNGMPEAQP